MADRHGRRRRAGARRFPTPGGAGTASAVTGSGPYPAKVAVDGRGSTDPEDRVRTDAYLAGDPATPRHQDTGPTVNGSTTRDHTTDGYWAPDTDITTGTDGRSPGMPTCSSPGIGGGTGANRAVARSSRPRPFSTATTARASTRRASSFDKYAAGSCTTVMCQAYGEFDYGGSAVGNYTGDGLWAADYYVRTG